MKVTINTLFAKVVLEMDPADAADLVLTAVKKAMPTPIRELMQIDETSHESTSEEACFPESGGVNEEQPELTVVQKRADPEKKEPERSKKTQDTKYKGFLHLRCSDCGEIRSFCAKVPISRYKCACGGETLLKNLMEMQVQCRCCGRGYKYQTNLTEQQITMACFNCGAPVDLELHDKKDEYITL